MLDLGSIASSTATIAAIAAIGTGAFFTLRAYWRHQGRAKERERQLRDVLEDEKKMLDARRDRPDDRDDLVDRLRNNGL